MAKNGPKQKIYSNEDQKLLEKIKEKKISLDGDLTEFRKLLEDEIYEEDRNKKLKAYEEELRKQKTDLKTEIDELITQKETLETEAENLKQEKISEGKQTADEIIKKARDNVKQEKDKFEQDKKDLENEREQLNKDKEDLQEKKDEFKEKEKQYKKDKEQLEIDQDMLKDDQEFVLIQKESYKNSNPEALRRLQETLDRQIASEDQLYKDLQKLQQKYDALNRLRISAEGINPVQLKEDYDKLLEKNTELENKINQYSEYKLMEMKRAYEQEDEYKEIIANQTRQIAEQNANLMRLKNSSLEFEQQQSQIELLRTLNNHLKTELDNTKFMLESSVGEVCPALTIIDNKVSNEDDNDYFRKTKKKDISLPAIVEHVVKYAASKSLYYSENDIKAFIAGMKSPSHLLILQGISGTGKTSLPKIFMKAILGEYDIVPVESSWRDRNELLGYYNDFSKKFTAKEFTCNLYKAGAEKYKDVPYFIVLDEMNLSRIEYYFADFLSVMENKSDDWKVKLVDTDLRQLPSEISDEVMDVIKKESDKSKNEILRNIHKIYDKSDSDSQKGVIKVGNSHYLDEQKGRKLTAEDKQKLITYLSELKLPSTLNQKNLIGGPQRLIDGNTIRIPKNVWFIGTANRDESTFEISDKVYDRAQVLNFNERANDKIITEDVDEVFISYSNLDALMEQAILDNPFKSAKYKLLIQIEDILKKGFKISFGNRIQTQMDIFVSVYLAASNKTINDESCINEALDYQIANKVLRKFEYEEVTINNREDFSSLLKIVSDNRMKKSQAYLEWKLRGE